MPKYSESDGGDDGLKSAGERLIDSAAEVARQRGYRSILHDSILIGVIRKMDETQIREAMRSVDD